MNLSLGGCGISDETASFDFCPLDDGLVDGCPVAVSAGLIGTGGGVLVWDESLFDLGTTVIANARFPKMPSDTALVKVIIITFIIFSPFYRRL
jgi:hypothetical protein